MFLRCIKFTVVGVCHPERGEGSCFRFLATLGIDDGKDVLVAGGGLDFVVGGTGAHLLLGEGDDQLFGQADDDVREGGSGNGTSNILSVWKHYSKSSTVHVESTNGTVFEIRWAA